MKTIDTLQDMAASLPPCLCASIAAIVAELADYFDGATIETVSFSQLWDSPISLVETVQDLATISSADPRHASLLAGASAAFDIAHWSEDGAFAVLGTIDTPLGGPQYIIPRAIADQAPHVAESIRLASRSQT